MPDTLQAVLISVVAGLIVRVLPWPRRNFRNRNRPGAAAQGDDRPDPPQAEGMENPEPKEETEDSC